MLIFDFQKYFEKNTPYLILEGQSALKNEQMKATFDFIRTEMDL